MNTELKNICKSLYDIVENTGKGPNKNKAFLCYKRDALSKFNGPADLVISDEHGKVQIINSIRDIRPCNRVLVFKDADNNTVILDKYSLNILYKTDFTVQNKVTVGIHVFLYLEDSGSKAKVILLNNSNKEIYTIRIYDDIVGYTTCDYKIILFKPDGNEIIIQ